MLRTLTKMGCVRPFKEDSEKMDHRRKRSGPLAQPTHDQESVRWSRQIAARAEMLNTNQSFPQLRVEPFGRSVPVSLSFLMHFAVVLIILRLPQVGAAVRLNAPPFPQMKSTIVYVVPVSKEAIVFAKMASAESGGAPGKGTAPGKPALGSSGSNLNSSSSQILSTQAIATS